MTLGSDICDYKPICKKCQLVLRDERPESCSAMGCEYFTPCKKCGKNVNVNNDKLCRPCREKEVGGIEIINNQGEMHSNYLETKDLQNLAEELQREQMHAAKPKVVKRKVSITVPGKPPKSFTQDEVDYYIAQWGEYEGFYADPTVYPLLHNLIILEIELMHVSQLIINHRGQDPGSMGKYRSELLKNINSIRSSLPEAEAREMSEDEKALSSIHDEYMKLAEERNRGGLKRMFDIPTIALAPHLYFPKDLKAILGRLGYKTIDIENLLQRLDTLPENPDDLMDFLGFSLSKEYALEPTAAILATLDDESFLGAKGTEEYDLEGVGDEFSDDVNDTDDADDTNEADKLNGGSDGS